jgi:tRNA(Ile)-lysidine synthase
MRGSKKVSDYLNEQKIEYNKKAGQFVLTNNGKIVWVIGLRIDNNYKLIENSKKVLKLCLT